MASRRSTTTSGSEKTSKKVPKVSEDPPDWFQYIRLDPEPVKNEAETQRTFSLRKYYTITEGGNVTAGFIAYNKNRYRVTY